MISQLLPMLVVGLGSGFLAYRGFARVADRFARHAARRGGAIRVEVVEWHGHVWVDHANGQKEKPVYHASVVGARGHWGSGRSADAALGVLVRNHPELFSADLSYPEGKYHR